MSRAAVRGVIDFTKARILDYEWWRYYFVILDAMMREDDSRLIKAQRDHHLALISNSRLTEEGFDKHQKLANDRWWDLVACMRPWEITDAVERKRAEYKKLTEAWEAHFGKMDDEETKRNIEREVERMKANAAAAREHVDEEALVQERMTQFWQQQNEQNRLQQEQRRRHGGR